MGAMLQGTVKSYCAKGYGFILCPEIDHDVYFARESLQEGLRTANIAGTVVSFELMRGLHGKPQARNLRPVGGIPPGFMNARGGGFTGTRSNAAPPARIVGPPGVGVAPHVPPGLPVRGWGPPNPGLPPKAAPPELPKRALSPHAGSRAIAGMRKQEAEAPRAESSGSSRSSRRSSSSNSSRSRGASKRKKKRRRRKGSGSSASGGSRRRRKSSKSSSSSSRGRSRSRSPAGEAPAPGAAAAAAAPSTEDQRQIEEAKKEALQKLEKLRKIESKDDRMKEWRSLLRAWHPDKNPDRVEVATAVFQFLQKGKLLLDSK